MVYEEDIISLFITWEENWALVNLTYLRSHNWEVTWEFDFQSDFKSVRLHLPHVFFLYSQPWAWDPCREGSYSG